MVRKICMCLSVLALCACVEQNSATSQVSSKAVSASTMPSFALKKASNKQVYVYVGASTIFADATIKQALEQSLSTQNFTVTSAPSEAGYIVHITPVYGGVLAQSRVHAAGDYGTAWASVGSGQSVAVNNGAMNNGVGLVLDVHVVSRKIATSSRYNMVAITAATPSVLTKKSVRMAAFSEEAQFDANTKTLLAQELARRIAAGMVTK